MTILRPGIVPSMEANDTMSLHGDNLNLSKTEAPIRDPCISMLYSFSLGHFGRP